MDANFSNSGTMANSQIDWMAMVIQMEKLDELSDSMTPPQPTSLCGTPSSSAYSAPPTPTSPIFNSLQLSPPPFSAAAPIIIPNSTHNATAANDQLFALGDYLPVQSGPVSVAAMREMIFRIAAMQPVHIDPESIKPPKRRNVRISKDPQSVAARHRRERISERIRILQRLVPGGTKMDTASMLDEAIHYVKFLKTQVQSLERAASRGGRSVGFGFAPSAATENYGFFDADHGYQQVVPGHGFAGDVQRY